MSWLPEPSPAAVVDALRVIASALAGLPVTIPSPVGQDDPVFQMSSAALGDDFVVKFAWSQAAARFILHQITVLETPALEPAVPIPARGRRGPDQPADPGHQAGARDKFVRSRGPDRPGPRGRAARAVPGGTAQRPDATPRRGGRRSDPRMVSAGHHRCAAGRRALLRLADEVLARPVPQVLVHGDLHGDNQVWSAGELQVVLDFENVGLAEPEYELRGFPGPGMGPGVELLTATMRHYERLTGRALSAERIMAWHVRQALGEVLWRSEASLPLPDYRSPGVWVDDIAARFRELSISIG